MREREWSNDQVVLFFLALGAVGYVVANLGTVWAAVTRWLTEREVLVTQGVVVTVAGAEGAGLDAQRVAIAAGVLVALLAVGAASIARGRAARRRRILSGQEA